MVRPHAARANAVTAPDPHRSPGLAASASASATGRRWAIRVAQVASAAAPKWVDAAGLCCALGYAWLAMLARQPGEPGLVQFYVIVAWTAFPVFVLYGCCLRYGVAPGPGRMIFWAIVFRFCGLAGGPFFEDDFFRYLWDGYRFATAGTPYGFAPEAFFVDADVPAAFRSVLDGVNNPDLPTIYGPATQLVFLVGYWLQPASVLALQSIMILVDLAVVGLLLRLAPTQNVLLYAWCPLVVKEVAFTAHPEGIGVCLVMAAVVLARARHWRSTALCLGLAAGAKVFALVLAPLILLRAGVVCWLIFAATLAALYAPFAIGGATDFESLSVFAREWEFNSAAFGVLNTLLPRFETTAVLGLAFVAFWMHHATRLYRNRTTGQPRGDWVFGALFLVSPVLNPWYLLWLLPFAAISPSVWAWTASVAVLLAYVTGINLNAAELQAYQQPAWVRPLEFGLILLAFAWDLIRPWAARPRIASNRPPS